MIEKKLLTRRFGKIDALSINDYIQSNGYKYFLSSLKKTPESVIMEIEESQIKGRGGAGFPTYIKLRGVSEEKGQKYVICNADEGEPANFKDRYLMENDPHQIIEGMMIAAYATGATKGFVYIRGEYTNSINIMKHAINEARKIGYLGEKTINENFIFDIEVRSGAGSYVCGEEFSLIESIEGKPGRTRVKPPFPTSKGVYNCPTLINNVETLAKFPVILELGGKEYSKIGTTVSTGTKLVSLSGNVKVKGVFEVPFGASIKDIIYTLGQGVVNDNRIKAIQIGGASGPFIPYSRINMGIGFKGFDEFDSKIGAGSLMVIDERFDLFEILIRTMHFFEHESCGKCTPCREGHIHIIKILQLFIDYKATYKDLMLLEQLTRVMSETSLCGLGQTSPTPIISSFTYFRDDYIKRIESFKKEGNSNG